MVGVTLRLALGHGATYLLAHGFRVGDSGAEETVPLQAPVQPRPVVVPIARVWQAPGDERVELPGCGITGFTCCKSGSQKLQGT